MCGLGVICRIAISFLLIPGIAFTFIAVLPGTQTKRSCMDLPTSDPEDELIGLVSSVVIEKAEFSIADGELVEGQRSLVRKVNYDTEGRQLEELSYDHGGVLIKKSLSIYDLTGLLQEILTYSADGSLICRQVYSHDVGKRTVEELAYRASEITKTLYSLDENGRMVSQTVLNSVGHMSTKLVLQYDLQNRLSEASVCVSNSEDLAMVPGGGGMSIMLSNEMRHRLKGVGPCSDALLTSKTVFKWDHDGHLMEVEVYTGEGVLIERNAYSREYDSYGNWIKQTQSKWRSESDRFEPVA